MPKLTGDVGVPSAGQQGAPRPCPCLAAQVPTALWMERRAQPRPLFHIYREQVGEACFQKKLLIFIHLKGKETPTQGKQRDSHLPTARAGLHQVSRGGGGDPVLGPPPASWGLFPGSWCSPAMSRTPVRGTGVPVAALPPRRDVCSERVVQPVGGAWPSSEPGGASSALLPPGAAAFPGGDPSSDVGG